MSECPCFAWNVFKTKRCQSFRSMNFSPEIHALFKHPTKSSWKKKCIFGRVCLWWLTFLKLDYELWHVIRHLDTFSHVSFPEVMTCRTTTSPDQLFLRALRKGTVCHFLGHNFPRNPTGFSDVSFWRPSRSVFPWKQYKSC